MGDFFFFLRKLKMYFLLLSYGSRLKERQGHYFPHTTQTLTLFSIYLLIPSVFSDIHMHSAADLNPSCLLGPKPYLQVPFSPFKLFGQMKKKGTRLTIFRLIEPRNTENRRGKMCTHTHTQIFIFKGLCNKSKKPKV